MAKSSVQGAFRHAKRDAGVAKRAVSVHTLRHGYATPLLDAGVNPRVIQRHMGHASLESTMRYLHLTHKGTEDAYALIDRVMEGLEQWAALRSSFGHMVRPTSNSSGRPCPRPPKRDRRDCGLPYRGRRLEPLRVRGLWAAARGASLLRNRHCPCCQQGKGRAWLERHRARQLPGEHFMVTFTVPEPLRPFLRRHQTIGYGALFAASSGAIKPWPSTSATSAGMCRGSSGSCTPGAAPCSITPTFTTSSWAAR